MNTSPTSTTQQDRIGQHHTVQGRRQGASQGTTGAGGGFAQLLSSAASSDGAAAEARTTERDARSAAKTPAAQDDSALNAAALAQALLSAAPAASTPSAAPTAPSTESADSATGAGLAQTAHAGRLVASEEGLQTLSDGEQALSDETLDPSTASPGAAPFNGGGHAAGKATGRSAVGRLVSSAARDDSSSATPPQSLTAFATGADDATRLNAWHMAQPGQPGSAFIAAGSALNGHREADGDSSAEASADALASGISMDVNRARPSGEAGGSGGSNGQGQTALLAESSGADGTLSAPDIASGPPESFAQSLGQAMGDAFEQMGAQVGYWAARGIQRATLQVQAGLGERIDVDVSLRNGEARLEFWADNPLTRSAIAEHAPAALAEMLARQGIGLGGLSVATQQRQGRDPRASPDEGLMALGRGRTRGHNQPLNELSQSTLPARAITGQAPKGALDVFV